MSSWEDRQKRLKKIQKKWNANNENKIDSNAEPVITKKWVSTSNAKETPTKTNLNKVNQGLNKTNQNTALKSGGLKSNNTGKKWYADKQYGKASRNTFDVSPTTQTNNSHFDIDPATVRNNTKAKTSGQSLDDRIKNTAKGSAKTYGASMIQASAQMTRDNKVSARRMAVKSGYDSGNYGKRQKGFALDANIDKQQASTMAKAQKSANTVNKQLEKANDSMFAYSQKLQKSGEKDIEKAKKGLGSVGKFAVDLGSQIIQWGADAGIAMVSGGSALVPMAVRSYGSASAEAREAGANSLRSSLYGIANATKEVATEKMFSPISAYEKFNGKGIFDNLTEKGASAIANKVGKRLGTLPKNALYKASKGLFGMVEEGAEEFVGDLVEPTLKGIYDGGKARKEGIDWSGAGRDFLIGASMGGVIGAGGGIVSAMKGSNTNTKGTYTDKEVKTVLDSAKNLGENSSAYHFAKNLEQQKESGKEILPAQVEDLTRKVIEENIQIEKEQALANSDEKTKAMVKAQEVAGDLSSYGEKTSVKTELEAYHTTNAVARKVEATANQILEAHPEIVQSGAVSQQTVEGIARIANGSAKASDIANVNSTMEAKLLASEVLGTNLPATNKETIQRITEINAQNKAVNAPEFVAEGKTEARREICDRFVSSFGNTLDHAAVNELTNEIMNAKELSDVTPMMQSAVAYLQAGMADFESMTSPKLDKIHEQYKDSLSIEARTAMFNAGKVAREKFVQNSKQTAIDDFVNQYGDTVDENTSDEIIQAIMNTEDVDNIPEIMQNVGLYVDAGINGVETIESPELNEVHNNNTFTPSTRASLLNAGKLIKSNAEQQRASIDKETETDVEKHQGRLKQSGKGGKLNISKELRDKAKRENKSSTISKLETVANMLGRDINIVETLTTAKQKENGLVQNGEELEGKITIALDAQNPLMEVFKHELTHSLQKTAPKEYAELKKYVFDTFYQKDAKAYNKAIKDKIQQYKNAGYALSESQAEDELLADATDIFFTEPSEIARLVKENRTLAEKIHDIISSLLDILRGETKARYQGQWLKDIGVLEEAERLWLKALDASKGKEVVEGKAKAESKKSVSADSDGNKLSEGQQEFFKDSKAVDKNGNLLKLYHGTPNEFTIFNFSQGGKNGTAEGFGIYLSDSTEVAKQYGNLRMDVYANITKPAYSNKKTIKKTMLAKLIKATIEKEAESMLDDYSGNRNNALRDTWISNYTYTYDKPIQSSINEVAQSILDMNDNDMEIIQEVISGRGIRDYAQVEAFYDMLTETTGIDGFMTTWTDSQNPTGEPINIVLALRSNQVKNVDNKEPTEDKDVRMSIVQEKLEEGVSDKELDEILMSCHNIYKTDKEGLKYARQGLQRNATQERGDLDYNLKENTGLRGSYGNNWQEEGDNKETKKKTQDIKTFGKRLNAELVVKGGLNFTGVKINSPADIAELFQIFRNPFYEIARIIFVKDNTIVGTLGITAKLPNTTTVPDLEKVVDKMSSHGADGYYLMHNHPSGKTEFSDADIETTEQLKKTVKGFKGHILLDHTEFAFLDEQGHKYVQEIPNHPLEDLLKKPTIEHPLLGQQVDGAMIANMGTKLLNSKESSVLVFTDADSRVNELQEVSNKLILKDANYPNYVKNELKRSGSVDCYLLTMSDEVFNKGKYLIESKHHFEVGLFDEKLNFIKRGSDEVSSDSSYKFAGVKSDELSYYPVSEKSKGNVKSADPVTYDDNGNVIPLEERFDSSKSDIRWSLSERQEAQVDRLTEEVNRLKQEIKLSKGTLPKMNELSKSLTYLMDNYMNGRNPKLHKELMKEIEKIYTEGRKGNMNWNEIEMSAYNVADKILSNTKALQDENWEEYQKLKNHLKKYTLSVNEQYYRDFGSYNELKELAKGKVKVSKNGTPVDVLYEELAQEFPAWFDTEVHDNQADQMYDIINALNAMEGSLVYHEGVEEAELENEIASQVLGIVFDTEARQTFADKQKTLRDNAVAKERQKANDRVWKQKARDKVDKEYTLNQQKAKYEGKVQKLSEAKDAQKEKALNKQKESYERKLWQQNAKNKVDKEYELNKQKESYENKLWKQKARDKVNLDYEKQKHKEQMSGLREQRDAKLEKQKSEYEERIEKIRKQREDAIRKEKARRKVQREVAKNRKQERADRSRLLKVMQRMNKMKTSNANKELIQSLIGELDLTSKGMTEKNRLKLTVQLAEYEEIKRNDPYFVANADLENKLKRLNNAFIDDMSIQDVRELTEALLEIENSIKTSNKLQSIDDKRETAELVKEVIGEARKNTKSDNIVFEAVDRYTQWQLSGMRFFRKLANYNENNPLYKVGNALNEGQRKMLRFQMESSKMFDDWTYDKKFIKSFSGENATALTYKLDSGDTITISPAMRASIYLHYQNEQNMKHVVGGGGLTIPDFKYYKKGDFQKALDKGENYKFSRNDIARITKDISPKEMAFIRKAQQFFEVKSKEALNETCMTLYGYEKANVDSYFPITTDKDFLNIATGISLDQTIEGMGSMKARVNASNPIMLEDIVNVINRTIETTGRFYGLAVPVRDYNKLINGVTWKRGANTKAVEKDPLNGNFDGTLESLPDEDILEWQDSTRKAIRQIWGSNAQKYLDNLITDLQGGRKSETLWLDKIRGNFAGGVLGVNISVTMKQLASIPTASATLGWTPVIKGLLTPHRVNRNLVDKYTPLLWYRSKGYRDQELGDVASRGSLASKIPWLFGWIQKADMTAVGRLWYASEAYVKSHNKDLKVGSDEYYQEVAKWFDKTTEETQPNYTTMQRPDVLRTQNQIIKAMTMFSTQRMQNFNITYEAIGNYKAKASAYHKVRNDTNKKALHEAQKKLFDSVSSQLVAGAVIVAMTYAAKLLMNNIGDIGDDDDKKKEWEIKTFFETLWGNLLFGGQMYEAYSAVAHGEKFYGFTDQSVELINNLSEQSIAMVQAMSNFANYATMEEGEEKEYTAPIIKKEMRQSLIDFSYTASQIYGLPLENMKKIVWNAGVQRYMETQNGKYVYQYMEHSFEEAWQTDSYAKGKYGTILKDAIKAGATEEAEEIVKMMREDGIDQDTIDKWKKDVYGTMYKDSIIAGDREEEQRVRNIMLKDGIKRDTADTWKKNAIKKKNNQG